MNITLLTNEYPPHVYGGAGVHVDYLSRELANLVDGKNTIHIYYFGKQRDSRENLTAYGIHLDFKFPYSNSRHKKFLDTIFRNIIMTGSVSKTDIIHCHTWYTHLAGCLIKSIYKIPLVITAHSLEPQRPWKEEQLGSAYNASNWIEKTALQNADGIIAVSRFMKKAVREIYNIPYKKIHIIPNGIDVNEWKPTFNPELLISYTISPEDPFILFVGRITRQKGIFYLLDAVRYLIPGTQVVLVASDPDTKKIRKEIIKRLKRIKAENIHKVIWIEQFIPKDHLINLYSHASVFICPSIYEPFGIINLEAMACGTPVVASAVGGILEVVSNEDTGFLIPFEKKDINTPEPKNPAKFSEDLASAINNLLTSNERRRTMGLKARERVEKHYSWKSIAQQTLEYYYKLIRT